MPRRRQSISPQTSTDVLIERIEMLEKRLSVVIQSKMSSAQVVDIENFNDPAEGMAAIDWPTGRYCFYHDNEWICVPAAPVHAIKVFSDKLANKAGDGAFQFAVEDDLDGFDIVMVRAFNGTVGTTGTVIQVSNNTRGIDILSTPLTIPAGNHISPLGTINESGDPPVNRVTLGDMIWIDLDIAGVGAKGLGVYITFSPMRLPSGL